MSATPPNKPPLIKYSFRLLSEQLTTRERSSTELDDMIEREIYIIGETLGCYPAALRALSKHLFAED
jgi:hypothetical protein